MPGVAQARLAIDFGTTHTVAVLAPGVPLLFDASPLLSSAVAAEPGGRLLTGRDALRTGELDPARFEPNPKLRIDDERVLLGDETVPVTDLIAAPLRRARSEAARHLGGPPSGTVLTCPAAWGTSRRAVLAEAAQVAGLGAVTIVPEPVAAAWYHAGRPGRPVAPGYTLGVYDLGGGTFDCTVLRRTPAGWDILATAGRDDVGGIDLDAVLLDILGAGVGAQQARAWRRLVSPSDSAGQRTLQRFRADLRAAKEQLSRSPSVLIRVPLLEAETHVTREEFEAAARPLLEPTVELMALVLARAGVGLDELFLVGGSSRVPLVATLLHQRFGQAPLLVDEPELVVAQGALLGAGAAPAPIPEPVSAAPSYGTGSFAAAPPVSAPPAPSPVSPGVHAPVAPPRPRRWAAVAAVLAAIALLIVVVANWPHSNRNNTTANQGTGGGPTAGNAKPQPSGAGSVTINKVAYYNGFKMSFGTASYADGTLTVELKVQNTTDRDRPLTTSNVPITADFPDRPAEGRYPGNTVTIGSGSEREAKAEFSFETAPDLAAGTISLGADKELHAKVPIGPGPLVDLTPVKVLAPTKLTVVTLAIENLTCELRGDNPQRFEQVNDGDRAVSCTYDVTYNGDQTDIGVNEKSWRLIMPNGDLRAPDDATYEVVDRGAQHRDARVVWKIPAPKAGAQYSLRVYDLDRYSDKPHGSQDVKLTMP